MRFCSTYVFIIRSEKSTANHSYQHDSLFNRFVKDDQRFDFNSLNQLLGDKLSAYAYDPNGNLSERHDQKYTYDAWDRLLSVTIGNIRFHYTYDDLSRRLSKVKSLWDPLTDNWVTQDTQYFLYQGDNEVGVCDAEQHLMEFRPLGHGRGAEIGAAVAFEIQGKVYVPLTNFTGHAQVLLNSKGEPVDIYRYMAFGEETIFDPFGDAKDPTTSWRFCSKRTDPETDLIYFGRRYYDPQIARWITADPLGYEAGPNLYAYVNNSPLTSIDLYGLHIGGSVDFLEQKRDQEFKDRVSRNVSAFEKGVGNFLNHPIETIDRQEMYCSQIYESFKSGNYSEILKQWDQLNDQQKENFIYERIGEAAIESGIAIGGLILTKSKGLGILQWAVKNRAVIRDFIDDLYQKTNSRSLNSKITEQEKTIENLTEITKRILKEAKPRTNKLRPNKNAEGPHTSFKIDPSSQRISGYETYDWNSITGIWSAVLRFRGMGKPHGNVHPPFILTRTPGKGPGSPLLFLLNHH